MWHLILKLPSDKQFMGILAINHKVSLTGYPLSYWKDKNFLYLLSAGFIFGDEKNKKTLIREIKNSKEVVNFESSKDFIISVTKQPLFSEPVYNPRIIRPNPVIINKEGYHIWDLACFDRKILSKVIDFSTKFLGAIIISFKDEKISNVSFTKILPELTDKQKNAMGLAIKSGYYNYPKSVKLESLAKSFGTSYSTFQAHLKKAEGRILPSIYKQL